MQGSDESRWKAAVAELAKFNSLYAPVQKKPRDENVLRKCIMGASKMLKIRLWSSKCLEADIDAEVLAASREVYALAKNKTASVDALLTGIEHFKIAAQRAVESAAPEEFTYQNFKVVNRQRFSDQACRRVLAGVDYLVALFKKRGVEKVIGAGVARIVLTLDDDANGGATASFNSRTRELVLGVGELLEGHAARILDDFTNETILHEFGHYVHRIYLTGEAREAWNEPWGDLPSLADPHKIQPKNRQQRIDPLEIVTEYGRVDQFEDFAETFVVFMAAPEKLTPTSKFRMQRALSLSGLYGKPVMRLSRANPDFRLVDPSMGALVGKATSPMHKIASPRELQSELRQLLDYAGSPRPSRVVLASKLEALSARVGNSHGRRVTAKMDPETLVQVFDSLRPGQRVLAEISAVMSFGEAGPVEYIVGRRSTARRSERISLLPADGSKPHFKTLLIKEKDRKGIDYVSVALGDMGAKLVSLKPA